MPECKDLVGVDPTTTLVFRGKLGGEHLQKAVQILQDKRICLFEPDSTGEEKLIRFGSIQDCINCFFIIRSLGLNPRFSNRWSPFYLPFFIICQSFRWSVRVIEYWFLAIWDSDHCPSSDHELLGLYSWSIYWPGNSQFSIRCSWPCSEPCCSTTYIICSRGSPICNNQPIHITTAY